LRRRTAAAQRDTAPGRRHPARRPRPRRRVRDRADNAAGRGRGPSAQSAPGQTTRQAARTAQAGIALGVDISSPAIERARELARAEGLRNVTFEHANAQVYRFPQDRFDLAISRCGTMFFDDPVAAFANIGRALRPAGRLVMMVWQAHERNEWDVTIHQSLGAAEEPGPGASGGPDPFSLADPPAVTQILRAAGFADVAFTDVHEPVFH